MKIDQIINQVIDNDYHAFFAPEGLESDLKRELKGRISGQGNMFLASPKQSNLYFLQNRWSRPRVLKYKTQNELDKNLKSFGIPAYFQKSGRKVPTQDQPPEIKFLEQLKPSRFLEWTYLDNEFIMVCEKDEGFPLNELNFQEDKRAPSRAYLKLWELFTRLGLAPGEGETCLELGSAPGGWTYVLDQLGCDITSVDRADLEIESPRIRHVKRDAFSVKPEEFPRLNWFFSDIICFPTKLAEYVELWIKAGNVDNFVCTLKFKGSTDWESIRKFENLGGELIHLNHNKHELTWYRLK